MKIQKRMKIELAASKDSKRYVLNEPYLDMEDRLTGKGTLVATDGQICAIVPVELDENDSEGYVSADVLKANRKQGFDSNSVTVNGKAQFENGDTMSRHGKIAVGEAYKYPNWRAIVPNFENSKTVSVALDAKLLNRLADAIGTEGVVLTFAVENDGQVFDAIEVKPTSTGKVKVSTEHDAKGIIMPIRIK